MTDKKYMSNSAEYWFGKRYDQNSIKDGLRGPLGGRAEAVKPYSALFDIYFLSVIPALLQRTQRLCTP